MNNMVEKAKENYKLKVDNQVYEVDKKSMTGKEILELSGHNPADRFRIDMKLKGGKTQKISLDEVVDLSVSGIEKFYTLPLGPLEG